MMQAIQVVQTDLKFKFVHIKLHDSASYDVPTECGPIVQVKSCMTLFGNIRIGT